MKPFQTFFKITANEINSFLGIIFLAERPVFLPCVKVVSLIKPLAIKRIVLIPTIFISLTATAQTGPGGVGNSNTCPFWIKADAGTGTTVHGTSISNWNDQSGNGNHAVQTTANLQPLYHTNIINGMPALLFDNNTSHADHLIVADQDSLDNSNGLTFYAVVRPLGLGGDVNAIMSKRVGVGSQQSYSWFFFSGNRLTLDLQGNDNRFSTTATFSTSTNYLVSARYDGTQAAASRVRKYIGGSLDITATESASSVSNHASNLFIGAMNQSDNRPFNGYISEIVIFRRALNTVQRLIVDNYLSAKYALSVTTDLYAGDLVANGNYDFDVAGIGTESDGSQSSFSSTAGGGLSIQAVSGFDNGDYVIAGRNAGSNSENTSDVGGMTGSSNSRWSRIWYLDVTNTGSGLVSDIQFNFSHAGLGGTTLGNASDYVLLYRSGQTGSWTEVATASTASGSIVSFAGVAINSDGYYTLGTKNSTASPLPVELISFDATSFPEGNKLEWVTAWEKNNYGFEVQRRTEGESDFVTIDFVKGHNNSSVPVNYNYFDTDVKQNAYYRLKQIDYDGAFEYSPVIALERQSVVLPFSVSVYPNPATDKINVKFASAIQNPIVKLYSLSGKEIICDIQHIGDGQYLLNLSDVPKGNYLIHVVSGKVKSTQKILIK